MSPRLTAGAYCCDVELDGAKTCFVVMPISVASHLTDRYDGRSDHFNKIYATLISPAIVAAGLVPRPTTRIGTENIPAAIINDLRDSDLVVADLSGLNPNVFLELGIRSALDKPVCLVWDGLDSLPFDSGTLNTHKYLSRPVYELNDEIARMAEFIKSTFTKSDGRNELWKFFGSASTALPTAELDPTDASLHAKLDRLLELSERDPKPRSKSYLAPTDNSLELLLTTVTAALQSSGDRGVHGSTIGRLCRSVLGDSFDFFLAGRSLSQALSQAGLPIHVSLDGWFTLHPDEDGWDLSQS